MNSFAPALTIPFHAPWESASDGARARVPSPTRNVRLVADAPSWRTSAVCPPDWLDQLARCGGTFFHTPPGVRLGASHGELRFMTYAKPGGPALGVALGAAQSCRLARRARHLELPAAPALAAGVDAGVAMRALRESLRDLGLAEVVVRSFDDVEVLGDPEAEPGDDRLEFRLAARDDDTMISRCTPTHRRHIHRGERDGWSLEFLRGEDARRAISAVQALAAGRADARGDAFAPAEPGPDAWSCAQFTSGWGAATVAAFHGATLLAAAVVGWSCGRAYYLIGGSTAEGYRRGAAAWLHFRTLAAFRDAGGVSYNLGGTPAGANDPAHASHGLYRFKSGFGALATPCRGFRWVFSQTHIRSHAVGRFFAGGVE